MECEEWGMLEHICQLQNAALPFVLSPQTLLTFPVVLQAASRISCSGFHLKTEGDQLQSAKPAP